MVDGIDKIGTMSRLDWYKLTYKEIQEYKSEGADEEMPSEVKRWAEEMAKMANIPDNVTYEMSKAGAVSDQNPESKIQNSQQSSGDATVDNALALGEQSDLAADEVENLMAEIEDWQANATTANNEAQNAYDSIISKMNALEAERASAMSKGDKAKASELTEKLTAQGKDAQSVLGGHSTTIANIQSNIGNLSAQAQNAIDIGSQAIIAGQDAPSVAETVTAQGENAINVGNTGYESVNEISPEIDGFGQNVRAYTSNIQNISGVPASDTTSDEQDSTNKTENSDKTQSENNIKTNEQKPNEKDTTEENDPANNDITTNPLEIIKRKERKGEA